MMDERIYIWPPKLDSFTDAQWAQGGDTSVRQAFMRWRLARIEYLERLEPPWEGRIEAERKRYRRDCSGANDSHVAAPYRTSHSDGVSDRLPPAA